MNDRQLMQQALDSYDKHEPLAVVMETLRDRLAHCDRCGKRLGGEGDIHTCTPKPVQEPVAWMFQHGETGRMSFVSNDGMNNPELFLAMNPRYALVCALVTPPAAQRTWVGLTDAELADMHATLMVKLRGCYETKDLYRAIEQRLKEKNNG